MTRWRPLPAEARAGMELVVLGIFGLYLPLDLAYALPGILTYATGEQVASMLLWLLALSIGASALLCAVCALPGLRRAVPGLAIALLTLGLLHASVVWLASLLGLTAQWEHSAIWATAFASVVFATGWSGRIPQRWLAHVSAALRASAMLMALLAVGAALTLAAHLMRPARGATPIVAHAKAPSIILITVDTLSALHLPMYGYPRQTAPRLTELAHGATLFLRNYANSNFTTSSMASLMYGNRPWTHRVIQHEGAPLASQPPQSLPARLAAAGYFTASVSTNPWAAPRNLELSEYFSAVSEDNVCALANPLWVLDTDLEVAVKTSSLASAAVAFVTWATDRFGVCEGKHYDPELPLAAARHILDEAPTDRPLFLWVHLFPPHDPYVTPEPFVTAFAADPRARDRASTVPPYLYEATRYLDFPGLWRLRYDQAILYLDAHLGGFLDDLKRRKRYDESLVIVTADHGESLSKGYGGHGGPALHDELVRVPLIVKTPYQRRGTVVDEPSEQVDLLPTILDLAGIAGPRTGEGVSLVPVIKGAALARPVFVMNFQQSRRRGPLANGVVAMVQGRWKYVHYFGAIGYPLMPRLEDALYDVASDPWETRNLIAGHAELRAAMLHSIEQQLERHGQRLD